MTYAIVAAATIGTAGSIYAGQQSGNAISGGSKRALRYQQVEARENRENQNRLLAERRADFAPWREAGGTALTRIMDGMSRGDYEVPRFEYADIDLEADPGYQFRMDSGQKAIENSAAARGGVLSGAALRELTRYGQDVGSQEYGNAYARHADQIDREANRRMTRFNVLNTLSNQGLTAAGQQAGATGETARTLNAISTNQGNQGGQLLYGQGVNQANQYTGTATAVNQGLQNWLTYRQSQGGAPGGGGVTNSNNSLSTNGGRFSIYD